MEDEDVMINAFMGDGDKPKTELPNHRVMPEGWERFYPELNPNHISHKVSRFLNKLDNRLAHRNNSGVKNVNYLDNSLVLIKLFGDPKVYYFYYDGITAAYHN